ncbi:MAG: hypothetical protein KAG61_06800 [Bacteriovoracaceae bacterium]|nr:hypothetical protein [Bacteriovoracaceae bacterium]
MDLVVYGIRSCEKIRKLKELFEKHEVEFEFIDLLKNPPSLEKLAEWTNYLGELPINKRGATYKKMRKKFDKLEEDEQIKLMLKDVAIIERPIIEYEGEVVGIGGRPERIFKVLFS